jgi:hypothetical protein
MFQIAVADSLKVLDLKRPIREADIATTTWNVGYKQPSGVEPRVLTAVYFLGGVGKTGIRSVSE